MQPATAHRPLSTAITYHLYQRKALLMAKKKVRSRSIASMIAITVIGVLVYRIGAHIPLPGVALQVPFDQDFLATASMLSGANLSQAAFFGLGVMPYIMAQIVMQILQTCVPSIKHVSQDGAAGRNKVVQWTRRLTVPFAAIAAALYLVSATVTISGMNEIVLKVLDGIILIGGAMLLMRIGEIIDENGVGQGMSVLICASILSQIPSALANAYYAQDTKLQVAVAALMFIVMVPIVVKMERAQKRVPITRAALAQSEHVDSYLPIRLIVAGVVPVIFASAIRSIPTMVMSLIPLTSDTLNIYLNVLAFMNGWPGLALEFVLIIAFAFIYTALAFDCDQIAETLAETGAYITDGDVAPGKPTAQYLRHVTTKVTVLGSVLLAVVAMVPSVIALLTGNVLVGAIGGTSLIIIADTIMQIADQVRAERLVAKSAA